MTPHLLSALTILATVPAAVPDLPLAHRLLLAGMLWQASRDSAGSFT